MANAPHPDEPISGVRIGRFSGVPIYVTPTWFIVAALITWAFADNVDRAVPGLGPWRYAVSLTFAVLLYASVLIHELSHTVVALRAGLPVRRISLYLLGGVSEIERPSPTPRVEAGIAAAGPLVSVLLGVVGLAAVVLLEPGTIAYLLAGALMWSNFVVGVFNLLPGLPLDGGRVLSAAVWQATGRRHTGALAASWTGRVIAVIVFFLPMAITTAFGGQPDLIDLVWGALLGAFIWSGASQSLQVAKVQQRIPALSARRLTRPALPVPADMPLAEALRRAQEAGARALVVVGPDGKAAAVANSAAIDATPEERRPWVPVGDVSRRLQPGMVVAASLAGEELVDALTSRPANEYLVVESDGSVSGVLVTADVEAAVVPS